MVKSIHWYELRAKKEIKEIFGNFFFEINENCKFWKKHGKCEKTLSHKNFNNRTTKKIFGIRTKLSHKTIFSETLLAIEMKKNPPKTEIITNQPVYLGWTILELSKIVMYQFWYKIVKPKCGKKSKNCVTWIQTAL